MRRSGVASFALFAIAAGATVFGGQATRQDSQLPAGGRPAATFKSEVGVIEINAVVTDGAGNFVRDLTRDDFQVYEDGRARCFSFFSLIDVPVSSPLPCPRRPRRTFGHSWKVRVEGSTCWSLTISIRRRCAQRC
jgi:hypothetical protein